MFGHFNPPPGQPRAGSCLSAGLGGAAEALPTALYCCSILGPGTEKATKIKKRARRPVRGCCSCLCVHSRQTASCSQTHGMESILPLI